MSALIGEDAARRDHDSGATDNRVVLLGDLIDRGPSAAGVIEWLLSAPLGEGFATHVLMGNHERLMLDFLDDPMIGRAWLALGGLQTLDSYGVAPPIGAMTFERLSAVRDDLAARLPDRHRTYLAALPLTLVIGDYLFVHAGIRPGVPLPRQEPEDLLWIREEFLDAPASCDKVVVHGHQVTACPEMLTHRIGLDTGAYRSGVLSCVVLEGRTRHLLQTPPDSQKKRSPISMTSPGITSASCGTESSTGPEDDSRRILISPLSAR